ncbi:MAG: zf-HC2 domain-containing protein [Magnetococcales bacterium]|nr:zf-HC2 domain-containing protein [Magnetococcales bacterium]MBF0323412.1 zf-HC2 domain-containing protein [Magnetococcales bacterium]
MRCDHELISAYLDGELDAALLDSVTSHLLDCPECGRQFSALAQARDAIQKNCLIPDPEGVIASVMAVIDQKSSSPSAGKNFSPPLSMWTMKNGAIRK